MSMEELLSKLPSAAFADRGRFAPKLSFAQRCEILALYKQGVSRKVLADAFGVDRRTVTHIYNTASPHYKEVRAEFNRLGIDDFKATYLTEEGVKKVTTAVHAASLDPPASAEGRKMRKDAGVHVINNENLRFDHRVIIEWKEDQPYGEGWYYQDMDGEEPTKWFHNGPDSMKSSQACLKAVKESLF